MDSIFTYVFTVTVLYAILSVVRNRLSPNDPKTPKEIMKESLLAGSATLTSYYLLNSLGFATISQVQKGGSTPAFTSRPEF